MTSFLDRHFITPWECNKEGMSTQIVTMRGLQLYFLNWEL